MLTRIRRRLTDDDGLSLVEMLIAIFIVGFAVIAMTSTLIASFTALVRNESLVHATSVANEVLEDLQALPWNSLALYAADVAPLTEFEGEDLVLLPEPPTGEDRDPLVPGPDDEIVRENRTFDVEIYITWVPDGGVENAFKRMVVIVDYEDRGDARTMRSETIRTPTPEEEDLAGLDLHLVRFEPMSGDDFLDLAIEDDSCYEDPVGANCGRYNSAITVAVVATEPVGMVRLVWDGRSGERDLAMAYFPERGRWETTIPSGEKFANGDAWFTARTDNPDFDSTESISEENPQYIEARRRQVFLHPLRRARFDIVEPDSDSEVPHICVNDEGELLEAVTVTIDLVGADPSLVGDGLELFWISTDLDEPGHTYPVATVADTTLWGGSFEALLAPDPDLPPFWDTDATDDPPDEVQIRIGPFERQVPSEAGDDDDFEDHEEFELNVVEDATSC